MSGKKTAVMRDLFPGYVIDTSALIDLWRRHYAKDVFPNVWKRLDELIHDGKLAAPHEVRDELHSCDDELLGWAQKQKFFVKIDAEQIALVQDIINNFPSLISKEKTIADADPFVIALARAKGWAVVTSEKSAA